MFSSKRNLRYALSHLSSEPRTRRLTASLRSVWRSTLALAVLVLNVGGAGAVTHHVPGDFELIQEALDTGQDGDTILVAPGIYSGDGNRDLRVFRDYVVRSTDGPEETIIDCEGSAADPHRGFWAQVGSTDSVIDGFTIRGGWAEDPGYEAGDDGAGILVTSGSIVSNCIVEDCVATGSGGAIRIGGGGRVERCVLRRNQAAGTAGIYVHGGGTRIVDCDLLENESTGGSGALYLFMGSDVFIIRCRFMGNSSAGTSGAVSTFEATDATFRDCLFSGNTALTAGAFYFYRAIATMERCTITGNIASDAGAMWLYQADITLTNSILYGNCAEIAPGALTAAGTSISFECCDVLPSEILGDGTIQYVEPNLQLDPRFCEPASCEDSPTTLGNYGLFSDSPCLSENNDCGELIGAYELGCEAVSAPYAIDTRSVLRIRPNPTSGFCRIDLERPPSRLVRVDVIDPSGRIVRSLLSPVPTEGNVARHSLTWDGLDSAGRPVGSGVFLARVETDEGVKTGRIVHVR